MSALTHRTMLVLWRQNIDLLTDSLRWMIESKSSSLLGADDHTSVSKPASKAIVLRCQILVEFSFMNL